jgi:hypothetical protein
MSDITEAVAQAEIADSLMDAPIVGSWQDDALADHGEEAEGRESVEQAERSTSPLSDAELDELAQQQRETQQQPAEQEQSAAEPSAEQIQESFERLDATVEQHGLNDAGLAKEFSDNFCQAFGLDSYNAGVDVQQMGNVMAKTALSAMQIYESSGGDPSKVGPIPAAAAKQFSYEFLKSWGVDPRTTSVNESLLASTVLSGVLNFVDSYMRAGGRVQSLEQLNSPEVAEYFLGNFLKAFGVETQVDRGMALKFADAAGNYLLKFMGKVGQIQPQAANSRGRAQASRTQATRTQSRRQASSRMRSNQDIFDDETLEAVEREHFGRTDDRETFAAKPRGARSPFTTNTDLFDAHTMDAWYRDNGRL